mmetsp:Transcript_114312/g.301848  ORF Transcript_114312/g.301848 Transcript_114312/m.301848 type:complete len:276 (-) Transcript_114312:4-831(-)
MEGSTTTSLDLCCCPSQARSQADHSAQGETSQSTRRQPATSSRLLWHGAPPEAASRSSVRFRSRRRWFEQAPHSAHSDSSQGDASQAVTQGPCSCRLPSQGLPPPVARVVDRALLRVPGPQDDEHVDHSPHGPSWQSARAPSAGTSRQLVVSCSAPSQARPPPAGCSSTVRLRDRCVFASHAPGGSQADQSDRTQSCRPAVPSVHRSVCDKLPLQSLPPQSCILTMSRCRSQSKLSVAAPQSFQSENTQSTGSHWPSHGGSRQCSCAVCAPEQAT